MTRARLGWFPPSASPTFWNTSHCKRSLLTLNDFEEETGIDVPIHVDGAIGGFIAPFLHCSVMSDFRIPRVRSINASDHKYGFSRWAAAERYGARAGAPLKADCRCQGPWRQYAAFPLNFSRPGGKWWRNTTTSSVSDGKVTPGSRRAART